MCRDPEETRKKKTYTNGEKKQQEDGENVKRNEM